MSDTSTSPNSQKRSTAAAQPPSSGRYYLTSRGGAGLFGAVTSRAEAQVRRFATIYAVLECSREAPIRHLLAGLSLWDYSRQSSYLIFRKDWGRDRR